eukprot:42109_1
MSLKERIATAIINDIIKTVSSKIYDSNILRIAKHFRFSEYLQIEQLREDIGDRFIVSNSDYPEEIYQKMDAILDHELQHKTIMNVENIACISKESQSKLRLWQGDITTLKIDAIVNAANTQGLGCFVQDHKCIDNVIHRAAGPRLRRECRQIFENGNRKQKENLPTGTSIITKAYCLPSKYVIHTTGPVGEKPRLLKASYHSVLDLCKTHKIRSVAFCCISTGIFGYPQQNAAKVAISTVESWLNKSDNADCMDYVVFNVFTNKDRAIYEDLLNDK